MDHPPYSLDLPTCDFWHFPKLKNALKGQRFSYLSDIQRNLKTLLRGISEYDFQDCFRQWQHRLTKCIASQGEYFEGDSSLYMHRQANFAFTGPFRELNCHTMYVGLECGCVLCMRVNFAIFLCALSG
jgi:hypothetical protein